MSPVEAELLFATFDEGALHRGFVARLAGASGAVVTFTGRMRGTSAGGAPLERLVLEHHPQRTAESLLILAETAATRFALDAVHVAHRAGAIGPGEAIVWVAAAARHRRPAFDAVDYLMDRLKNEAVFWKREEGPAGRHWIEPSAADGADRQRWNG